MSYQSVVSLPRIQWRIKTSREGGYWKEKFPPFTVLAAKFEMKFVYCRSGVGMKTCIILKRCGVCTPTNAELGINVTLDIVNGNGTLKSYTKINIGSKTDDVWFIWDFYDNEIAKKTGKSFFGLCRYGLYFVITFDVFHQSLSTNTTDVQALARKTSERYSPCVDSICQDFGKLFNNHTMSDIILQCGEKKIYAHTAVLAARSPVFAFMFRMDLVEAKNRSVDISDIEPDILDMMIRYMYCGEIQNLSAENVDKVYAASDKYAIEALRMKCGVFMVEDKDVKNEIQEFSPDDTERGTVRCHFKNIKAVLATDEWKKLSEEEPKFAYKAFQLFVSESP